MGKGRQVLERELGKDFDLDKAVAPDSGWKGRHETILAYQDKIKEAEAQLAASRKSQQKVPGGPPSSSSAAGGSESLGASQVSAAEQARQEFFQAKRENWRM